ncbi:unnamed protein product, partial [Rotaria sp. Silwood2]
PDGSTSTPTPTCSNPYQNRIVRASGDYQTELGSTASWLATEENSLMRFDATSCLYLLTLTGLTPNKAYQWKVTFDNSWANSLGCGNGSNCQFSTNTAGAIELVFNPISKQLSNRPLTTVCGNEKRELGERCRTCLADCGQCPPAVCGYGKCEDAETCESCSSGCGKCPVCDDGTCQSNENHQTCSQDCPNELPGCYQPSYQGYPTLVGYADIIYTATDRRTADVCLEAKHRYADTVKLTYFFDGVAQENKCKRYTSSYTDILQTAVTGSDGSAFELPEIDFIWNAKPIASRSGDYRNGQKGAVAEMFGWPHNDIKQECEFLSKAGYLSVQLFPVHEQLLSTQSFEDAINPWYFM